MNENRHPIDDLFRDGLDQHSVEPPMHVWERIDQTRTPVYKLINNFKQHSSWYLSVAAGLVFMSAAAIMFLSDDADGNLVNGEATLPAVNQTEIVAELPSAEQSAPVLTNEENLDQETPASITNTASLSLPPALVQSPTQANPIQMAPGQNATQTEPNTVTETPAAEDPNTLFPTGTSTMPGTIIPAEQKEAVQAEENPVTASEEVVVVEEEEIAPAEEEILASENPSESPEKTENQETKNMIPLEPSPWSIELLGSYDFINRRMPNATPAYAAERKQDEKVQSAFSLQLRAQYKLNPVLSLRSGIAYSRINEQLNHSRTESYTEIIDRQVTGYILDPINGPTQVTYTVRDTVNHSSTTQVNSNNRYTFVDVPVLLNYTFYTSNKWSLGVSGGPMFNLVFQQRGYILSPNQGEVIDLSTSANPYRTYAGVNLMLNASASYSLNKHFDIVFEPGIRYGLSSLTNAPNGMIQKNNSLNLFTGLRYNF